MPDWTYHPLAPLARPLLGEERTHRWALRLLASLVRASGNRWIPVVFDHPTMPEEWQGRFGAVVPPSAERDAQVVLPVQGASVVRVMTAAEIAADDDPRTHYLTDPDVDVAVDLLADPETVVLARPEVLLAAGPGWFNRVIEAATPVEEAPPDVPRNPLRWPGWLWGVLEGLGLIVGGLGAALITLGPVLLGYDRAFLGLDVDQLTAINPHLVHFVQHDRITMAGNMISLGLMYAGLSWGALRRGHAWARKALAISGLVSFGSLFYFFGHGYVEPLHVAVSLVLGPMLLAAVLRRPGPPAWRRVPDGPEPERRRALTGQLILIALGVGLTVAGVTISTVGLTGVFVPTDLEFLHTTSAGLHGADPQLLPFIAHDRAGFGGALIGSGLAVLLIALWGFRRGERWVWWTLLGAFVAATVPVLVVHWTIGYTSVPHLLPVYVLIALTAVALWLSRPYLLARA
jgi:hypothetical protein